MRSSCWKGAESDVYSKSRCGSCERGNYEECVIESRIELEKSA